MRLFALFVAICSLTHSAIAQTPTQTLNCKSIRDPAARLGCYDKAASTAAPAEKPIAAKPAASASSKFDTNKYVDSIDTEEALVNARLKNICRGC
jgi:hypothetical protein